MLKPSSCIQAVLACLALTVRPGHFASASVKPLSRSCSGVVPIWPWMTATLPLPPVTLQT
jgi:hypothetical protein